MPQGRATSSRAAKVAEEVFDLTPFGIPGELRYNERGFMRAHCKRHGAQCRRQRQTTPGRAGAGRPIGSLVQWLREAEQHDNHLEHVCALPAMFRDRVTARNLFTTFPNADSFLNLERSQYSSEMSPEPPNIP